MALSNFFRRFREQSHEDGGAGGGGGGSRRPSPAEINQARNNERLSRMEEIGRVADGRRAREMVDVDHERPTGRFAGGEFDDSPEARERAAAEAEELARQSLEEQQDRAQEAERLEQEEARRLQEEGGANPDNSAESPRGQDPAEETEADERVIDGVRYYRTIVSGEEKWLTLKQLREGVSNGLTTEETLRRAQEALASASHSQPSPKPAPEELPDERELENIILSASMGDEEAVRKLASVVRARPKGAEPQEVSRLIAQQIATQREVDRAEQTQADLLGNETLAPIFKMKLAEFARARPTAKISDAYKTVGDQMRKDFAPMLSQPGNRAPVSKQDRKRTIVNPPQGAGRQPPKANEDREVPLSEQIDAIAQSRGQQRAHRIRRS